MTQHNLSPEDIKQPIKQAVAHPWFERLERFGYAAQGIVYFVVGLLAAQAAFGIGGETTDPSGALVAIVTQPFGKILLAVVAVGLVGYALLRWVQAIFDPEHRGQDLDAKRIAQRLGYLFSALAYSGLAFTAVKLISGLGGKSGNAAQDWTARFLNQPFGQWLVGLAGLVVIGVGLSFLYQAVKGKFRRGLQLNRLGRSGRNWAIALGTFGIAARGVVFTIIGIFLVLAALHSNASEARGIGGALATLAQQPYGPWVLGSVALGLIAYSIYCLIEARYRQIVNP